MTTNKHLQVRQHSRLRVWYITMQFPAPTETFAVNDVRALQRVGIDVEVHALRTQHSKHCELRKNSKLSSIVVTHFSWADLVRAFVATLIEPSIILSLLVFILQTAWLHPNHLVKCIVLAPRVLSLYLSIAREKPDVVHLFWGHYPSMLGFLISKMRHRPVITQFLGAYDMVAGFRGSAIAARRVDAVFTHAHINRPALEKLDLGQTPLHVVHRGIDRRFLDAQPCSKVSRQIITVSALQKSKGVHKVLEAFALIQTKLPGSTLVIIGDGPERSTLEAQASSLATGSVRFLGHLRHDAVFIEMQKSEVFLFMSAKPSERLPNVVKEAIAAGCYPVISNTVGIDELVCDGISGRIVPIDDITSAADSVVAFLENPSHFVSMLQAGRAHLEANFDLDRCMERYVNIWQNNLHLTRNNIR